MIRIACIGECMMELSEQPDGSFRRGFGGDTLNTAVYLARLGATVDYVTALGDDPFSAEMITAWHTEGIGTELVLRCPGTLPGLYMIQTDPHGERRFSYWRDSAPVRRLLSLPDMHRVEQALLRHQMIYLSGITLSLFDADGRERLFSILDHLRAQGGRVAFDTNFRPRGWPDRDAARFAYDSILRRADLVFASVEDCQLLWGDSEQDDFLPHLRSCGMKDLVLKLQHPGCIVAAADGSSLYVPAPEVTEIIDTTAAGDSFAAAFIVARASGASSAQAAERGHRLAGRVIAHRGAIIPRSAMPATAAGRLD